MMHRQKLPFISREKMQNIYADTTRGQHCEMVFNRFGQLSSMSNEGKGVQDNDQFQQAR